MKLEEIKSKLKPIVAKCVLHGDFTLASGKKSDLYFDGRLVTLSAEGLSLLSQAVLEMIAGKDISAVGGMAVGADPITGGVVATAGARGAKLSGFIVRKEAKAHGTGKQVEGPKPPAGAKVVLLEDVVTTGGSSLKALEAVKRELDVKVIAVIALLDRLEGGAEALKAAGVELWPVFTRKDFEK
ncbi:MAG TPA: orotate phosphoribosyltransferase [Planctomycetota bacterium]|nr:orotate phosphoribosyltransferase [Planctomycetota bacterium]